MLLSEPSKWGQRLTRMDFTLARERGRWKIDQQGGATAEHQHRGRGPGGRSRRCARSTPRPSPTSTRSSRTSTEELSAAESRYKDTPILDYINKVQTDTVTAALAGTEYASLPVLSIAAPFSRTAVFPPGDVKIKDVAGLYIYDNTLEAVVLTGAEVRAYLEYSAKYFVHARARRPGRPGDDQRPGGAGLQLRHVLRASTTTSTSAARSVHRITRLQIAGADVAADAASWWRSTTTGASGGGNFPGIVKTQVYNAQQEIRQLLIDWAQAKGAIDPADFFVPNWRLVRAGVPVFG